MGVRVRIVVNVATFIDSPNTTCLREIHGGGLSPPSGRILIHWDAGRESLRFNRLTTWHVGHLNNAAPNLGRLAAR